MSFDKEWAAARAQASQNIAMQLNSAVDGNGGRSAAEERLKVSSHTLRDRAGKSDTVRTNFSEADDEAARETGQIRDGLKGFKSAEALDVFQKRWRTQMAYMSDLLESGVAGNLRAAANDFAEREKQEKVRHSRADGKVDGKEKGKS